MLLHLALATRVLLISIKRYLLLDIGGRGRDGLLDFKILKVLHPLVDSYIWLILAVFDEEVRGVIC